MNKRFRNSGTSLFLMELMVAILFFSVASAVCMQLFARAHLIDLKTRNMNHAISVAQTQVEEIRGSVEVPALPEISNTIYYDSDWNVVMDENAPFVCKVTCLNHEDLMNIRVEVYDVERGEELYTLQTAKYFAVQ